MARKNELVSVEQVFRKVQRALDMAGVPYMVRPFSLEEFNRRRAVDVAGLKLFVAAPEDIVIAKLEWAKLGESERQIEDAASIIRVQGQNLDVAYVERWVRELELKEQWLAAKGRTG